GKVKGSQGGTGRVAVSGGRAETTPEADGSYLLTFDQGTRVTLTYAKAFHVSATRDFEPLTANVRADVSIQRRRWSVSGSLLFGGEASSDQYVKMTGPREERRLTNSLAYQFRDIPEGERVTITADTTPSGFTQPDPIV